MSQHQGRRHWEGAEVLLTKGGLLLSRKEGPDVVLPNWASSPLSLHINPCLLICLMLRTYLCSFKHLPLVEDFHGIYAFSVLHFDNSNLPHKWEFNKNLVNGTQKVSTFHITTVKP